jgi:predicted acetyltransferase
VPDLVPPTEQVRESFVAAMAEFHAEGRGPHDGTMVGREIGDWTGRWQTPEGFATFVKALRAQVREDTPRPEHWVPSTTLWWVEGVEYIGRVAIRHRLTPALREVGGHIGYDVRPTRRREGHATAMLRAALPVAHGLGIDPALVTCDATNLASRKVIEHNGGVLGDQRGVSLRFWVPTG